MKDPTHYLGHTLDVVISRDTSDVVCNVKVTDIGLSDDKGNVIHDHFAVVFNIKQVAPLLKKTVVQYRKLQNIDVDLLRNDIQSSEYLNDTTGSMDALTERYLSELSELINVHAPLITRTVTLRPHAPWYNEELRDAKQLRRQLERKWRHTKLQADLNAYRRQCGIIAKSLSAAKMEHYSNKVEMCKNDPKSLFQLTNLLLVNQQQKKLPDSDDDQTLSNQFNDFFHNKIARIRAHLNTDSHSETYEQPLTDTKFTIFRATTSNEIRSLILTSNNSSCILDPIPTKLLKQCVDEVLPMITAIVNKSLTHGHFPSDLKHALIKPHLKKPGLDTNELNHYRPVSNLHFLSKIIEKIVVSRLEEHMYAHNLYDPLQSAYRAKHATETAIIKLNNDIIGGMDEGKCTILASLDLSAAFDTVDHDILLRRLQNVYGIDETALLWFKLYLKDRTHRVYIKETLSERHNLDCGVPQGSVLGARLYSMYAYPLCTIINEHNLHYHSYADDTQIYMQCDNNENAITDVIVRLENCIKDISSWMMHNSLQINENKTDFIIFSTTPHKLKKHTLQVGTNIIALSKTVKILGVTFDDGMTLKQHISNTCRSSYMQLRKINSIRQYLTTNAVKTLVQSVVISRLDYCNSTYIGLPTTTTHKLQLSHNAAARIINKTRRHEHITPILQELHWLPIMKRVQFKVLVYTFKAFHNEAPIYLCDLLSWYHPNRPLRSANRISLVPNRHRTVKLSRRLLDTAAATLWNDLPDNIRNCDNTWTFKKLLKTYLF